MWPCHPCYEMNGLISMVGSWQQKLCDNCRTFANCTPTVLKSACIWDRFAFLHIWKLNVAIESLHHSISNFLRSSKWQNRYEGRGWRHFLRSLSWTECPRQLWVAPALHISTATVWDGRQWRSPSWIRCRRSCSMQIESSASTTCSSGSCRQF